MFQHRFIIELFFRVIRTYVHKLTLSTWHMWEFMLRKRSSNWHTNNSRDLNLLYYTQSIYIGTSIQTSLIMIHKDDFKNIRSHIHRSTLNIQIKHIELWSRDLRRTTATWYHHGVWVDMSFSLDWKYRIAQHWPILFRWCHQRSYPRPLPKPTIGHPLKS